MYIFKGVNILHFIWELIVSFTTGAALQLPHIASQSAQQAQYCSVTLNCNKSQIQLRAIHGAGQCYLQQVDTNGTVIETATGDAYYHW